MAAGHTCAAVRVTGSRVTVAAAQVSWIARLVRDEGDGGSGGSSRRLLHARATEVKPRLSLCRLRASCVNAGSREEMKHYSISREYNTCVRVIR